MMSKSWRAGLLVGALGLLAAFRAEAQPAPQPPGVPPSVSRAGQPAPMPAEILDTGCPVKCVPEVETKKRDVRCYGSVCYKMCYLRTDNASWSLKGRSSATVTPANCRRQPPAAA